MVGQSSLFAATLLGLLSSVILLKGLSAKFRCIAPDHIAFGLSPPSDNKLDWTLRIHPANLEALLDQLKPDNRTLYLTDWGEPIGLDLARKHPG